MEVKRFTENVFSIFGRLVRRKTESQRKIFGFDRKISR